MKGMKGVNKKKKEVEIIHPDLTGKVGKKEATIVRNTKTKRYDFHIDGSPVLSAPYQMCVNRAEVHGVKWA